jgi:murein L,D-transpeptidase YcbB/YkuD
MIPSKYFPLKLLIVALAAATGGCATHQENQGANPRDYTYCSRYGNLPECGGAPVQAEAAPAAAAAPVVAAAAAPASTEKTVTCVDAGAPPNVPGQCYIKEVAPAEWRDEPQQELVRAAGERVEYTEPVYEMVEEQVVVKPAGKTARVIPAEYADVEEQVLVREAYRREIQLPALYNTYFEKVMERPARQVWKPGRGTVEKVDPNTGEILCLVEEEAVYKNVERKELARAASTTYQDVPAEYATVKKTVLKSPERVEEVEVPAEYTTVKVNKMVKAPQQTKVPVEAQYATVSKKVMASPPRCEWVQVLCIDNSTPAKIQEVKRALNDQGASPQLQVDGELDQNLTDAVRAFQEKNGLRTDGLMTADTLAKLGVPIQ